MLKLNVSSSLSKSAVRAGVQPVKAAHIHRRVACSSLEKRFQESYTMSQGNSVLLLLGMSFLFLFHLHASAHAYTHTCTHTETISNMNVRTDKAAQPTY